MLKFLILKLKIQLRDLLGKFGNQKTLSHAEFITLYDQLDSEKNAEASRWKKRIGSVTGTYQVQGMAEHGADEIVHTIREEVKKFFRLLQEQRG